MTHFQSVFLPIKVVHIFLNDRFGGEELFDRLIDVVIDIILEEYLRAVRLQSVSISHGSGTHNALRSRA